MGRPLCIGSAGSNTEDPAVIRVLLEAGADIRSRDVDGNTPLHWAARNLWYRTTLLQALLDAGADINARNSDGETPLAVAIKNDNQPAIQVLQENGASQ